LLMTGCRSKKNKSKRKISSFNDLGIVKEDKQEGVDKKLMSKLGLSILDLQNAICISLKEKSDEIAKQFFYIAPFGDYSKLVETVEDKSKFLIEEAAKPELWHLIYVDDNKDKIDHLKFIFQCEALTDGSILEGFAIVDYTGKIQHTFCLGEQ
jgi:hypothetical protein